jgi:hypothetical protein
VKWITRGITSSVGTGGRSEAETQKGASALWSETFHLNSFPFQLNQRHSTRSDSRKLNNFRVGGREREIKQIRAR